MPSGTEPLFRPDLQICITLGAMWSLPKPRVDKRRKEWHFAYWCEDPGAGKAEHPQQLFFWDDEQTESGVVLFQRNKTVRYSLIRSLIEKLVADPELRKAHHSPLRFPVQRYYMKNGLRPE